MKMKLLNLILIVICLSAWVITGACNQASQPTVNVPPEVKPVKHYHLKGKVVSVDQRAKMLNVDSETIPGFMDAMTMPYKVKPESELEKLHPGDAINADLLVQDEGAGAWLENIAVTGHSSQPAAK
jgi:protein SCO1